MKLQFDAKDIEALLLAKAKELGIEANTVDFDNGYSYLRGATVYFKEAAPVVEINQQEAA